MIFSRIAIFTMGANHRLGHLGEDLACLFLQMCGYVCLHRRYRIPAGEIDLVMKSGNLVVFVEVKTRHSGGAGRPEDFVTQRKLAILRRAVRHWLANEEPVGRGVRLDVVAVEFQGEDRGAILRHYRGVV